MTYLDEIIRRNKSGQNSGKSAARMDYEEKKRRGTPGLKTAQAGVTAGAAAIHQRMQNQIAQAQQALIEKSQNSVMFRERPVSAVPASLSPLQRIRDAATLPDMSESERLKRQLEAMEKDISSEKEAYSDSRKSFLGDILGASLRGDMEAGAQAGRQFAGSGDVLTQKKKDYNNLLDQYNAALAREKQEEMSRYSAQEIGARLDSLRAQRDAAEAELKEAAQAARTTPYTIYNPEAKKAALDRASQAKVNLDKLEQEYTRWLNQYYIRENEEKRAAASQDKALNGQYNNSQELSADLEKVTAVMDFASYGSGNPDKIEEYKSYLAQKYGLDQQAIDRQARGFDASTSPRTDGGYNNVKELYDQLNRQLEAAVHDINAAGYDYNRMAVYEQMLKDRERAARQQKNWREMADKHPVLSSLGTVAAAPAQGLDYLKLLGNNLSHSNTDDYANYVPANTYNMDATNFVSTIRGEVSRDIEENTNWEAFGENVGSFLYNTGMSMADSAVQVATLGKASLLFMGMSAASNQAKNVIERGGTNRQAMMGGLAAGAAEVVFEKFSIDSLLKIDNITDMKSLVKSMAKQAGVEGSEEMFTEIANILSDAAIMRGNSDFANSVAGYRAQGLTEQEAKRRAYLDCVGQVAWAGAGGALSGFGMGGGAGTLNLAGNYMGSVRGNTTYTGGVETQGMSSAQTEVESAPGGTAGAQTQINTNPLLHTIEQQRIINEYQGNTDQGLKNAFEEHYKGKPEKFLRYNISPVSERQAADASRLLGGDYSGYTNAINSSAINHIIKRHGPEGKADHSMADMNDPARVGYVLDNYDSVEVLTQSGDLDYSTGFNMADNTPAPMLMFKKRVDGTYYVVEAVPDSKYNKMWVVSAYMSKANENTGDTVHASDVTSPEPTSVNEHAPSKVSPVNIAPGATVQDRPDVVPGRTDTVAAPDGSRNDMGGGSASDTSYPASAPATEFNVSHGTENVNESLPWWHDGSPFAELQYNATDFHKTGENPSRRVAVPTTDFIGQNISKGVQTALEANATPDAAVEDIENAIVEGRFSFNTKTDVAAVKKAEKSLIYKGWETAARDWFAAARGGRVSKDLIVMGQTLYNNAVNARHMQDAVDILAELVAMNRTSAQALQASRVLKKMSPEWQLYAIERSVQRYNDELKAKRAKEQKKLEAQKLREQKREEARQLREQQRQEAQVQREKERARDKVKNRIEYEYPDIQVDPKLYEEFLAADSDEARDAVKEKILQNVADQVPSTWLDKWNAWRYLSMLGNPRTHIRNIAGNAGFLPVRKIKDAIAYGIESAAGLSKRGEGTKAFLTRLSKADRELIKATYEDFDLMADQVMGDAKYSGSFSGEINERRTIFQSKLGKPLEWARNFNSNMLEKEDVLFAKPAYSGALASWLKANDISAEQFQNGEVSPEIIDKARAYAIREAQRATYRDVNAFSKFVSSLGKKQGNTVEKVASDMIEGVLPFKSTPANILVRGVEYSPAGLIKGLTYDLVQVHNGNMEAWQAIDNISSGLTGSGLMALGVFLSSLGLVSGGRDKDEITAALDNMEGYQSYALNVGGKSVTLDWLAPEALPFFVGVELQKAFSEKSENGVTFEDVLSKLSNITEPMLEMSMLQGVEDLFSSIKYADGYTAPSIIATAAVNYLSQGLPTLFGQIERITETERETTYIDKTSGIPSSIQRMLGKAGNKIPFWDYQQQPYVDEFGQHQSSGNVLQRVLNNMFNPAYVNDIKTNEVTEELRRLDDANELTAVPEAPPQSFKYGGKEYNLTGDEYTKAKERTGQEAFELMRKLINNGFYDKLSDAEKNELLSQVQGYAKDRAKAAYLGSKGVAYEGTTYKKMRQADSNGIGALNWLMYDTELDKIKGEGTASYLESAQAASKIDATNKMRGQLWALQNPNAKPEKNPFTGTLAQMGVDPEDVIQIMKVKNRIADDYENYVRDEEKAQPSKGALMASIYWAYLVGQGYAPDVVEAVERIYNVNNMIISSKTSKQSERYVAQHPELIEKYG